MTKDCEDHYGIRPDVRCCLEDGHAPPCVSAVAQAMYGPTAVVLSMPSQRDKQAAMRRASLLYAAQFLEANDHLAAAEFLRGMVIRMRRREPMIPRSRRTRLDEVRRRDEAAFDDTFALTQVATMFRTIVYTDDEPELDKTVIDLTPTF